MILTKEQAQAVYSAMCALNNVCAVIHEIELEDGRRLRTAPDGSYVLSMRDGHGQRIVEAHPTQHAFATAYELLEPSLSHLDALETIASGNTDPDRMVQIAKEAIASAEGIKKCPGVSDSQCGWSKTTGAGDTCKVCGEILPF